MARPRVAGAQIISIIDGYGLPLAASTHAANRREGTPVLLEFDPYSIDAKPQNVNGDHSYDSDAPDQKLRKDGIKIIAPHRCGRKLETHDGCRPRQYERRWIVESSYARMQ